MTAWFRASYRLASYLPLEEVAEILAGEQSCGTFTRVAGETATLKRRHGARVGSIHALGETTDVLPGSLNPENLAVAQLGIVEINFPVENVGPSLTSLLNTVAGNLFEIRALAGVKLLDVEIPDGILAAYPGPAAGIEGTRALIDRAHTGPIIGTIVKPSIGLAISDFGSLVRTLAESGIDFIKDDELNANPPFAPLAERIKVAQYEIERASDLTGKKTMYAFNISDDLDVMLRNADLVAQSGGTCVMVTIPTIGLPALRAVRERSSLPIHGHRAGFMGFGRSDALGMSYTVFQKFARMAGADHLHVGGVNSKFFETNDSVLASIRSIQEPLGGYRSTLPVLSSAQSAATAEATYKLVGSDELMVLAGGGITGHPGGVPAGVESMKEAWAAAAAGESPSGRAINSVALAEALEYFGGAAS